MMMPPPMKARQAPNLHLRYYHHRHRRLPIHTINNSCINSYRRLVSRSRERHLVFSYRRPSHSCCRRTPLRMSERTVSSRRRRPVPTRASTTRVVSVPARIWSMPVAVSIKPIIKTCIFSARVHHPRRLRTRGRSRRDPSKSYRASSMGRRPYSAATCLEQRPRMQHQRRQGQCCRHHHHCHHRPHHLQPCHYRRHLRHHYHYLRRLQRRMLTHLSSERCSDWRRAPNGRATSCRGSIRFALLCVCALHCGCFAFSVAVSSEIFASSAQYAVFTILCVLGPTRFVGSCPLPPHLATHHI
jgi:hypothetical protein